MARLWAPRWLLGRFRSDGLLNPAGTASHRLSLVQVVYDEGEQERRLALLLQRWREHFVDIPPKAVMPGPWLMGELAFAEAFSTIAVAFKSRAFAENEWRLVYRLLKALPDDDLKVSFRPRNDVVLPYVEAFARQPP